MAWIIAACVLAVVAIWLLVRRRSPPAAVGAPFRIAFDDRAIVVTDNDGARHEVLWNDLEKVAIRAEDDGPLGADVFWGLQTVSSEHVLVFPDGAQGERELIDEMTRRLAGFKYDDVVNALGATSTGLFVLWERGGAPAPAAADTHEA